jgi:hypothetical protein
MASNRASDNRCFPFVSEKGVRFVVAGAFLSLGRDREFDAGGVISRTGLPGSLSVHFRGQPGIRLIS